MANEEKISPEVVTEATSHGWVDKEHFKGNPGKWVDAKTFLDRGETFIPFLKAEGARTRQALEVERQARQKLETELEASRKSIETLNKLNEEDRAAAVEAAKKEVKAQIAEAVKSGDTEVLGDLTEQLVKLSTPAPVREDAEEEPPVGDRKNGEPLKAHPDYNPWVAKNPWYTQDAYKRHLAFAEAVRIRQSGDTTEGMAFYDKVSAAVDTIVNPRSPRSKVEEGDLGGGGGDLTGSSSYDNLPAEAKAECNREVKNRVGPNKTYKTPAEWQKRFAELYFSQPGTRQ